MARTNGTNEKGSSPYGAGLSGSALDRAALMAVWRHSHGVRVDGERIGADQGAYFSNWRDVLDLVRRALGNPAAATAGQVSEVPAKPRLAASDEEAEANLAEERAEIREAPTPGGEDGLADGT